MIWRVSFKKQVPTDERKPESVAADTQMHTAPASIYSQQQASLFSCSFTPRPHPYTLLQLFHL